MVDACHEIKRKTLEIVNSTIYAQPFKYRTTEWRKRE